MDCEDTDGLDGRPDREAAAAAPFNDREDGEGEDTGEEPLVILLGEYHEDDMLTKLGMAVTFKCTLRTVQRMVDRYEIPPGIQFAGRCLWRVGRLKTWIANIADAKEAEAVKQAKRLNAFRT